MSDAKETILNAAAGLLNSYGLEAVTIRNVADSSNYGRSTVTHHFGDKDSLLSALHIAGLENFAGHILGAQFSPSHEIDNLEAQKELFNRMGAPMIDGSRNEAAAQIYIRFRDTFPGFWKLLRFRQCPDFEEVDAPMAHAVICAICGGHLEGPIGLTVDLILHQLFSLHEWISQAKPAALLRIMQQEPSLNYWLATFSDPSHRTVS